MTKLATSYLSTTSRKTNYREHGAGLLFFIGGSPYLVMLGMLTQF